MATGLVTMVDLSSLWLVNHQVNARVEVFKCDCSTAGLVITCHITGAPLGDAQKLEMIRYLRNVQREDGGWGL